MTMKKEDQKPTPPATATVDQGEEVQDKLNALMLTGEDQGVTLAQGFDIFEAIDPRNLEQISGAEYYEFEKPGIYHFLFMGMDKFTSKEKGQIDACKLQDRFGKNYINANTILVNSLRKVTAIPSFVKINYVGDEKNAAGQRYKNLLIQVLPASVKQ